MKRTLFNLVASAAVLGLSWLAPHSPFKVTLETPTPTPAARLEQPPATEVMVPTVEVATPEPSKHGELYFTLVGFDQNRRLVRLPGECVVGLNPCPAPEVLPTPFSLNDVFTNISRSIIWSRDGRLGAVVVHPEDELSRGRTKEELDQLMTQSPADLQTSDSSLYLFDAENDQWRELVRMERKFIYTPVWSADGQWLAFAVRRSMWAFHPLDPDDGIYVVRPDGSQLKQLAAMDASPLGWVGNSVAVIHTLQPYPAIGYAIELLDMDGRVTTLFNSSRKAYYALAPDGGSLLVTDAQGESDNSPQKSVELLALDGSVTHSFGVFNNMTASIYAADWSRDSSQIAFASLRRVYVAPRQGEPAQVYAADDSLVEPRISALQFSPDQQYLLMDVYDGLVKLVVVALDSGQAAELVWEGMNSDEQPAFFSWRP